MAARADRQAGSTAPRRRRKNRPSPRDRLLSAATQLFTTEGIRVIGIDRVLREADVAKASLYSLFGSKDALVVAYIQQLDSRWRAEWEDRVSTIQDPEQKILEFFRKAIDDAPTNHFRGSHFLNVFTEYPAPETTSEQDILDAAREHRRWLHDEIARLVTEKNGYPGHAIAYQLLVLLEGGFAGVQATRTVSPLETAFELAQHLLGTPAADYAI